jgi:FAD/FMN-containing dehydrogenase
MGPYSVGATYPNFLGNEGAGRMKAAFGAGAERLAAVKQQYDPHGLFHTHQAIRAIATT